MANDWRKLPSMSTGGKPFFYRLGDGLACVVWHRGYRAYVVEAAGRTVGTASHVGTGKRMAEAALKAS